MTDSELYGILPGSRMYYEQLKPDYEGARYEVCANLYSEELCDYVAHYDGHVFDNYEMASDFYDVWMPDRDELVRDARESGVGGHFEVEVAIWDETGNLTYEDDFYNETVEV